MNDYLLRDPDYFNAIPDILLRWRERKTTIVSDIEEMFSQLRVTDDDRPSQRFLWRGQRRSGSFDVYEFTVVIFGAKSSPSVVEHWLRGTVEDFAPS